jgi:hypothetical protein
MKQKLIPESEFTLTKPPATRPLSKISSQLVNGIGTFMFPTAIIANNLSMKKTALLATSLLALATFAQAVPTEINYQGVLTDQNGNPVNGVRAMQIKIYDAPTGGTLLYSEDLGNVPVQDGIYAFAFGANGTSNALTTETIAIANGTVSTFQKVLSAPTVVAGSVTVTDGTYTWDQINGSSNENDFSVAYSPNLRRVTVTYYNGAPAAGKTISATYRSPNSGINEALTKDSQLWIDVSVGGVTANQRQKVLKVPFAQTAAYSTAAASVISPAYGILFQPPLNGISTGAPPYSGGSANLPFSWTMLSFQVYLPKNLNFIRIKIPISWGNEISWFDTTYTMDVRIRIGNVVVDTFTIKGRTGGSAPVMSFDRDFLISANDFKIPKGFSDIIVEATLKDYITYYYSPGTGSINAKLTGGTARPWLISED